MPNKTRIKKKKKRPGFYSPKYSLTRITFQTKHKAVDLKELT